ncbi:hypothetical protein A8990_10858 [Paenibacillus taihuensis]|uniref:Uncharacterized protein n=1 Tax=Paenibacillus taihuensis TaxID=1156355 RepID=A0A3D9S6V3_9BACL|nr:hypothetical protein [Paenibacillus taihuensis]REE88562.1 hypothetical protein A8990_10858 [Paenibacillus taihuensis]
MRLLDWLVAVSLVVIGIACLTMAATWMMGSSSAIHNFFSILMWTIVPLVIAAIVYFVLQFKQGERGK